MPRLLIADGSPMMHRIMELTFATEGLQVLSASDGEQAIALLPIARPDIVIADYALRGVNGYEVAEFIREHPALSHIPVLLMASPFEPLDQARAGAAGVAGEISKPFDPAHLVARVRELLTAAAGPRRTPSPGTPSPGTPSVETPSSETPAPSLKLVEPTTPPSRGALDDYFDRLDAALERLDDQFGARAGGPPEQEPLPVDPSGPAADVDGLPTIDQLLASPAPVAARPEAPLEPRASPASPDSRPDIPLPRGGVLIDHPLRGAYAEQSEVRDLHSLAEALGAFRAGVAQDAPPMQAAPVAPDAAASGPVARAADAGEGLAVSDALVDEVTRRVLERLAPDVVRDVVTQVAERLLREEIAKLKH